MKVTKYFSSIENTLMPKRGNPDVIKSKQGKIHRKRVLRVAIALGLIRNQESSLEFIDNSGRSRMIISRVIELKDEYVLLQNNRMIPITKISSVVV